MSGEESARIAEAFIEVSARKSATFNEQVRRMGEEAGDSAGKSAGKEMADSQEEEYSKGIRRDKKGKFAKDGEQVGKAIGEAAASRAARDLEKGLTPKRTGAKRSGTTIGDALGKAAGKRVSQEVREEFAGKGLGDLALAIARNRKGADDAGNTLGGFIGQAAASRTEREVEQAFTGTLLKAKAASSGQTIGAALGKAAGARVEKSFDELITGGIRRRLEGQGERAGKSVGAGIARGVTARLPSISSLAGLLGGTVGRRVGRSVARGVTDGLKAAEGPAKSESERIAQILASGSGRRAAAITRETVNLELAAAAKLSAEAEKAAKSAADKSEARLKELKAKVASFGGILRRGTLGVGGVSSLAGATSGLGSILTGAAGGAVTLSGALGVLPALMVGAATSAGVLKIGLSGVSDALKDSGDPKKFAADLKTLAPPARDFVKELVKLKPQLRDLQKDVQSGLFKGLADDIKPLASRYLPVLSKGLTGISRDFNLGAKDLAKFFNAPRQSNTVARILADVEKSAHGLTGALKPASSAILDVLDVGSSFLPGGASAVTREVTKLGAEIDHLKANGGLKSYFQGGLDAAKNLGKSVGSAGKILTDVFKASGAAKGGGGLGTFADVLGSIEQTIGSPGFQRGLTDFFSAISTAGHDLGQEMPEVGAALVSLEPALAKIVTGSGTAFASVLHEASQAAEHLAPTLNFLATVFDKLAPHAGAIVAGFLAIKGALALYSGVRSAIEFTEVLTGKLILLTGAETAAEARTIALGASMKTLGAGAAVIGTAALATQLGPYIGKASVASVSTDKLAQSIAQFHASGKLGADGLKLFQGSGLFGLIHNDADSNAEAFKRFSNAAEAAFGTGLNQKIGRAVDFGKKLGQVKQYASELDPALAQLAKTGQGGAASDFFQHLTDSAVKAGAPIAKVQALFPQYAAAVKAAGGATSATAGAVDGLSMSLDVLKSKISQDATETLTARAGKRAYAAALDQAREAAAANGRTLRTSTEAGRANQEALDNVASSGIAMANSINGHGVRAQANFRRALEATRANLISAGERFGLSKKAAERYADSVIKIPPVASTRFSTPGLSAAVIAARNLERRLAGIPEEKRVRVVAVYSSELRDFASHSSGEHASGGLIARRASGGILDGRGGGRLSPRLGGPRQDNVHVMASGGEFVVNAFATAAPGVLSLLRSINASNQLPSGLASGGRVVGTASRGFGDITASMDARHAKAMAAQPPPPQGLTRDDLAAIAEMMTASLSRAIRSQPVVLDTGVVAGAVYRAGGGF